MSELANTYDLYVQPRREELQNRIAQHRAAQELIVREARAEARALAGEPVDGEVLDVGDTELIPSIDGLSDTSVSLALPGLELAEFEHQITTALGDLIHKARTDPEGYNVFAFQDTIQQKMVDAMTALDGAVES